MALVAVEALLAGRRVLEAAPTSDQTDAFWQTCCAALAEPIKAGKIRKNESSRILELLTIPVALNDHPNPNLLQKLNVEVMPRLPRIRCKTAWDADSLRGDYADLLILDEFSLMEKDAWEQVGAPMLLDNNGDAVFIFTPKSLNHAHVLFQRAKADETGRWEAFHFTSLDNPHLSREALAEIVEDMTAQDYQQEILARFLQGEGAVFRNVEACLKAPPNAQPAQHAGHRIGAGIDFAKKNDWTVASIGCLDCGCELELDRFNQVDYLYQVKRLAYKLKHWNAEDVLVDATGVGDAVLEMLRAELATIGIQS